jgi:hypothetical protein
MNPTAAQLHKNVISPLFTICYTFHVLLKTTLTAESRINQNSAQSFYLLQLPGNLLARINQTALTTKGLK